MMLWSANKPLAVIAAFGAGAMVASMGGSVQDVVEVGVSAIVGYLAGAIVGPDLDLVGIDHGEGRMIRSVVFIPLVAWTTLYARIIQVIGGHRSIWSHMPLLSTFIRLCWFTFPLVVLAHTNHWLGYDYTKIFGGLLVGLTVADTVHSVADFRSTIQRKFGKRRSRRTGDC